MGVLIAFSAPLAVSAEERASTTGFALLSLHDSNLKWGALRFGTPGVVRYAFLKAPVQRGHGTNCRAMEPFPARLAAGGPSRPQVLSGFRRAFDAWQKVAAIRFLEVDNESEADLVLGVQARPRGVAFADIVYDRASPPSEFSRIREAAICLNPEAAWETDFDGNDTTFNVGYVALHEIGHVIGLDHSRGEEWRVMDFKYREVARTLQPEDTAGAALLYGPPATAAAGLPAPTGEADSGVGAPGAPQEAGETSVSVTP